MARRDAGALLADAVGVIGIAVRGGRLAGDLRVYKSDYASGAAEATARLRELLASYLDNHGGALWQAAGMTAGPTAAAVVPSGRGRLGSHPLVGIARSCVDLPLLGLHLAPGVIHARGVDVDWLRVTGPAAGADVLVVDDLWVSGGSAQSAAAALKLAGACHVAVVALGRHVNPDDRLVKPYLAALTRRNPA
jgi:hypothetical protein